MLSLIKQISLEREADIEQYFRRKMKAKGALPVKVETRSLKGFPDRIVLYKGLTFYVEVKKATGKLSPNQVKTIEQINALDIPVFVLYSKSDVDRFSLQMEGIYK